jgi:putative transcriptional regulator
MRWSRVRLPYAKDANVFLLRIAAGSCLPPHTHSGEELTQVLHGAFDDGRSVFGPGDFDATDDSIRHQPVVQASSECICLASVDGHLVHDGLLARWMGALIGI